MYDLIFLERTINQLFVGRIDPRAKLILFISFILVVLILPSYNLISLVALGLILALLIFISGLPGSKIVKAILKIYPMILIMSFLQILTIHTGNYLYSGIGILAISEDFWIHIAGFQIKTIVILGASLFLVSSTPMKLFLTSLEKLRAPGWVVAITFFIYHFVFILIQEITRLQIAYQSRYVKLPVMKRVKVRTRILAVFLTRIFERNDRLYNALISRGFNGDIPLHIHLSWKYSDTIVVLTGITFLMLIHWMV
jgi:cobalt/nickel transport system permease protein